MDNLLHQLHELQERHGWLSDDVLRAFSRERNVPLYQLEAVSTFYPHYRRSPPPRAAVSVCRDAACRIASGEAPVAEGTPRRTSRCARFRASDAANARRRRL